MALVPRVGSPAFVASCAQKTVDMPRRVVVSDSESGSVESGSEESDEESGRDDDDVPLSFEGKGCGVRLPPQLPLQLEAGSVDCPREAVTKGVFGTWYRRRSALISATRFSS